MEADRFRVVFRHILVRYFGSETRCGLGLGYRGGRWVDADVEHAIASPFIFCGHGLQVVATSSFGTTVRDQGA